MALTYDETFQTAKDALNKMLERADADQLSYDKISVFLGNWYLFFIRIFIFLNKF
jgi:hypothetical protein